MAAWQDTGCRLDCYHLTRQLFDAGRSLDQRLQELVPVMQQVADMNKWVGLS